MLIQKIKQDLVSHIKSGDKIKISITRLLIAALKDKEISLRNNQDFDELINDSIVMEIINKMIKQRKIAAQTYEEANRADLAEKELKDIVNKDKDLIDNSSGKTIKIEEWGLLNLAKKINNFRKAFFIHYKFEGNNNTINKNKLNINIFLNEQCKDAITMEQFMKKIEVSIGNLLVTQNKGLS